MLDGMGLAVTFNAPRELGLNTGDFMDFSNRAVRKVAATGIVATLAVRADWAIPMDLVLPPFLAGRSALSRITASMSSFRTARSLGMVCKTGPSLA